MINVLVVDDEETTAAAHAEYLGRCSGFRVAGIALTGRAAVHAVAASSPGPDAVDLVILDINLPDMSGLEVARALRARRLEVDLLIVSAHRDAETVRAAAGLGVVGYLIKPFGYAQFERKMMSYREYHRALAAPRPVFEQAELDRAFAALQEPMAPSAPKGLSPETLATVADALRESGAYHSAGELARTLGLSRVTARRYLEHLCDRGLALRRSRYGTPGRPELEYGWRS